MYENSFSDSKIFYRGDSFDDNQTLRIVGLSTLDETQKELEKIASHSTLPIASNDISSFFRDHDFKMHPKEVAGGGVFYSGDIVLGGKKADVTFEFTQYGNDLGYMVSISRMDEGIFDDPMIVPELVGGKLLDDLLKIPSSAIDSFELRLKTAKRKYGTIEAKATLGFYRIGEENKLYHDLAVISHNISKKKIE